MFLIELDGEHPLISAYISEQGNYFSLVLPLDTTHSSEEQPLARSSFLKKFPSNALTSKAFLPRLYRFNLFMWTPPSF